MIGVIRLAENFLMSMMMVVLMVMLMMMAMMMMIPTGKDQREYTTALTACRDVSQSQLSSPLPSSFWYNDDEDDGDGGGGGDDYADGERGWRFFFVKNKAGISDLGIQTLTLWQQSIAPSTLLKYSKNLKKM